MNGVLGKVAVGALTLVPGAGLLYLVESVGVLPRFCGHFH